MAATDSVADIDERIALEMEKLEILKRKREGIDALDRVVKDYNLTRQELLQYLGDEILADLKSDNSALMGMVQKSFHIEKKTSSLPVAKLKPGSYRNPFSREVAVVGPNGKYPFAIVEWLKLHGLPIIRTWKMPSGGS